MLRHNSRKGFRYLKLAKTFKSSNHFTQPMSFLKKLMFWKKDDFDDPMPDSMSGSDPFDSPEPTNPFGQQGPTPPQDPFGSTPNTAPFTQSQPNTLTHSSQPELELISSKLDTLKVMMSSIEQRMAALERQLGDKKLW
jgi:hypothetical protein